jgi:hypothetical protein
MFSSLHFPTNFRRERELGLTLPIPDVRGNETDDQMSLITPATAYPICTIANTPRLPEHCIEWASVLEWPKVFKGSFHSLPPLSSSKQDS